ncbi:MAG: DUF6932 family protein [Gammaproteobacteria bacterium]
MGICRRDTFRRLGRDRSAFWCEHAGSRSCMKRFFVFGSFVSDKAEPRDVDVALIMDADFEVEHCPRESQTLFSHADADARFGASVFWLREGMLPDEVMQDFFDVWQTNRDGSKRGMLEVINDSK